MLFSSLDSSFPEEIWTTVFNKLSQRIRQYFMRPEPHQRALAYIQGLMSEAPRKNGWQVAEEVGEAAPYAMQHLLFKRDGFIQGSMNDLKRRGIRIHMGDRTGETHQSFPLRNHSSE